MQDSQDPLDQLQLSVGTPEAKTTFSPFVGEHSPSSGVLGASGLNPIVNIGGISSAGCTSIVGGAGAPAGFDRVPPIGDRVGVIGGKTSALAAGEAPADDGKHLALGGGKHKASAAGTVDMMLAIAKGEVPAGAPPRKVRRRLFKKASPEGAMLAPAPVRAGKAKAAAKVPMKKAAVAKKLAKVAKKPPGAPGPAGPEEPADDDKPLVFGCSKCRGVLLSPPSS